MIKFIDMFAGIGGFREGLTRAGGFTCVGHCEIDKHADRSYRALFDTEGEWFVEDARKADPETMPEFQLLCGGFPCQAFSTAGSRKGFGDPRGTLFFELARLAEARQPEYLLFENVPGFLNHDGGRTFATILNTLDRLGYAVEWQCLNSKDFGVPQSRKRVYIIGYLDERCRGKVFPFTETAGTALVQKHGGPQGKRVYSPEGVSCTLTAMPGGFGGKTGLYEVGLPIKCATNTGYQLAEIGDSIDLSYATINSRRGRVGKEIAHTLTTGCRQGTLSFIDLNSNPEITNVSRCITARINNGMAEELNRRYPKVNGKWYVSAVRRILMNEKYIGDIRHQKNFTTDELPLRCMENKGELPQYYVENHHAALITRQEYEKVQMLLKSKGAERHAIQDSVFSHKVYCAECGSVFSRRVRTSGAVVWGCRTHLNKAESCPVESVYETELCRAFLSAFNKLKVNRQRLFRPMLDDLSRLKYLQEQKNDERLAIDKEIQRLSKQNHNLERIRAAGYIEDAQYWERRAAIEQQLIEKKALLQRRVFNKNVENVLARTKVIVEKLEESPPLDDFDEAAFCMLVRKVKISNTVIEFELVNGMKASEEREK